MKSPSCWSRTTEQVQRWKNRLGNSSERGDVFSRIKQKARQLRHRLDEVIVTRLPQFRDVVEAPSTSLPAPPQLKSEGKSIWEDKRGAAERLIEDHAGWSVANAFNPVPGLDIGLDLQILNSLCRSLAGAYDLGQEQTAVLADRSLTHRLSYPALHQMIERATPRLAQGALAVALRRVGLDLAVREVSKWVPLAGSVVSAAIGYRMVRRFGESFREECEACARATAQGTGPNNSKAMLPYYPVQGEEQGAPPVWPGTARFPATSPRLAALPLGPSLA